MMTTCGKDEAMEQMRPETKLSFAENLERLESVLAGEHRALLAGDAKSVAALAVEKEQIAEALNTSREELGDVECLSSDIKRLAAKVKESADLNHMLLQQMYQHYNGMLELFMRIGGKSRTYGKNGMISIDVSPEKGGEILA